MHPCYGQHGEDSLLWQVFGDDRTDGYFVEIGALDGRCLSNTLSFEQAGWRGLCIEAHADYYDLLRANRPNSVCVRAAVSNEDTGALPFHANQRGSLSTLEPQHEALFRASYAPWFSGFEVQSVRRARLITLLQEAAAPPRIDFLTIDVEGHELAVLEGMDFRRYAVRVVMLEELTPELGRLQQERMRALGYHDARKLGCNRLYCRYGTDVDRLREAQVATDLIRLLHPLDAPAAAGGPARADRPSRPA
jgi:FkbM family methyltransferase